MAETVTAYLSEDKRLFKTEPEALEHELYLAIDKILEKHKGQHYRIDSSSAAITAIIRARKDLVEVLQSEQSVTLYKYESQGFGK